ncbi:hypothetical protein [Gracilibacillus suaedae]|uniref:hypothetical protein n=1 Tax=Gracilibacillus suaedae TaxID=2820273 RepID=UPI001ABDD57D|nr:hypothetical protein [Gracilibacillus suaedae]
MKHFIKKLLYLKDIKYSWLLFISILVFTTTIYMDLAFHQTGSPKVALVAYAISLLIVFAWAVFNYIGHIRLNGMYKRNNNIKAFVDNLVLSNDERLELQAYLEDYSQDLIEQGMTKEDAIIAAINEFKVNEFSSISKNTQIFNMHAHYYLGGYALLGITASLILLVISNVLTDPPLISIVLEVTFMLYGIGFFGLFFVYKLMDIFIHKKLTI